MSLSFAGILPRYPEQKDGRQTIILGSYVCYYPLFGFIAAGRFVPRDFAVASLCLRSFDVGFLAARFL